MNIYRRLNQLTLYIEQHLETKVDYTALAKILNTDEYTMRRIFSALVGISLAEYIRQRRLSNAACDLLTKNWRIIDLAMRYGYSSSEAFSRAFTSFHKIKPSAVKPGAKIRNFPRPVFSESIIPDSHTEYTVIDLPAFTLYGTHIDTSTAKISQDAPRFFAQIEQKYLSRFGHADFGMVKYRDIDRCDCSAYYVLYNQEIPEFEQIKIPAHKWLRFITNSYNAHEIQKTSKDFYNTFLPSSNYQLANLPELEYYHDGITEFLVPITTN